MRIRFGRFVRVVGGVSAFAGILGGLSACADDRAPVETTAPDGARVISVASGALTAPSDAARPAIVRDFVRDLGTPADTLALTGEATRDGVTFVRMTQEIDGRRVVGAYVKAALDADGALVHVIDRTTTRAHLAAVGAELDPRAVLTTVLAHLGYDFEAPAVVATKGQLTRFASHRELHRAPTVERVAYLADDGAPLPGWLVETWSTRGNQLDHTLVDARGRVVSVEHRTANDRYNVFVEDPGKDLTQVIVDGDGWVGTGDQTATNITGNNAHAYLDVDNNGNADPGGAPVTNGDFLAVADLTVSPATTTNRAAAVQNLFYFNNVLHDVLYGYGFDELAGNFQTNNFGRGGAGNDAVNAEAQDGGGTDNANFATPADGGAPRMQMYLWSSTAPTASVAVGGASWGAYPSSFGGAVTAAGVTGPLALFADAAAPTGDACTAAVGSLTGKVALLDRGTCDFTVKVMNAQKAGAIAVIIANNDAGPEFAAGGTDRKVKIPSVMVSRAAGTALRGLVGQSVKLAKSAVAGLMIDGDLDADIVFHEYGHGLTWRMIGGMSGALSGAIGEGASDVLAFLLNGDDVIGEYAAGWPTGIRREPYGSYTLSYGDVTGAEVHDDGEIYAAAMWAVRDNYLAAGFTVEDVLADWVQGMNYTPSTPAYENMRDGLLQAAPAARDCLVWRGFAKLGIGEGARGSVNRRGQVSISESFTVPVACR